MAACVLLFMNQASAQVNLNSGLVMHLPFDGNALDATGNGHNGIVYGATPAASQNGMPNTAYQFDGLGAYIRVPNSTELNPTVFTLCAKVKLEGFYQGNCYNNVYVVKGHDRETGSYSLRSTQTVVDDCAYNNTLEHNHRFDVQDIATPLSNMNTEPYLSVNEWDCLIGTYDGDSVKMYVNNVLRYAYRQQNFGSNTRDIFIGRSDLTYAYPFISKAVIDDVRLYNRELNSQERNALCGRVATSIKNINREGEIQISPNPAADFLTVDFNAEDKALLEITITDLMGRKVVAQKEACNIGTISKKLDVSTLAKGVYMIRVACGTWQANKKFVKQ